MIPYIPHSDVDVSAMLDRIGISNINDLFADIPEAVRLARPLDLPKSKAEADVFRILDDLSRRNTSKLLFLGAGQYDHVIPSVVKHLTERSEFVTAYTPYQPEISQGILQTLFEFQSSIAAITGLPVSNASLYDGFTAAAEACSMAVNARRKSRVILTAGTIHPFTKSVLKTYFGDLDVEIVEMPEGSESHGRVPFETLAEAVKQTGDELAGVLVQTPNIYGALEDLSGWADMVHAAGACLIVSSNPLSLGTLASPAQWGADIAVGDTQPLGLPPCFGGPSAGYIACTKKLMRRMPGRIVGETIDSEGRRAFVLTLQAREQHIKRERATSNICSNQSLAALANTIYLAAVGQKGFIEVSQKNIEAAAALREKLVGTLGLEDYTAGAIFNEFTVRIPVARKTWETPFEAAGIASGIWPADLDPSFPKDLLTVAVTEKRTAAELESYTRCAREALK